MEDFRLESELVERKERYVSMDIALVEMKVRYVSIKRPFNEMNGAFVSLKLFRTETNIDYVSMASNSCLDRKYLFHLRKFFNKKGSYSLRVT